MQVYILLIIAIINSLNTPMSTLLEGLNKEQLKAVTHSGGPLLIVAGAGTGKTTVITRRIAYLITQNLAKAEEVLALTFTDKAAGEMEERVDQLSPLGVTDYWISTFHSFCQRILEAHGLDIGLANDFKLVDDTAQWILIYNNFDKFDLDYYRPLGNPSKFIDQLRDHFSKCKDELITPEDYLNYAENLRLESGSADVIDEEQATEIKRITELANAYHVYQKLLLDNECLDFGDLINYCIYLFEKRPNILKYYQQKFKHVLVDEFQDTNYAQYKLIKLLTGAENRKQNLEQYPNLIVVGDDDQSIYKFRGASVSNILKLKSDYPDVKELTLVENYRSRQEILDLAYNFIQNNNPDRLESQLKIKKKLKGHNENPGVIEVLEGTDLTSELNLVVKTILDLRQKYSEGSWNDYAILLRANSAASEVIPKLDSAAIPYTFLANKGLYQKSIIADILSYCKLLDNYHDSKSLYRVLNLDKFKINPEDLAFLGYQEKKSAWSLYLTLKDANSYSELSEESKKSIDNLLNLIAKHSEELSNKSAAEMFVNIIADIGIIDSLLADTLQNAEKRDLLDQFYKKIENFESEQIEDKTLKSFLKELELERQAGSEGQIKFDPNSGPESLKIMTVHSSKGLEFKHVFIINMVDQRFPSRAKKDPIQIPASLIKDILPSGDGHLQEERRLFYVALTRAKENLYVSWSKDYGGSKAKQPSIFLQETNLVPSEKVNKATGKVVFTKPTPNKSQEVFKRLPTKFSFSDFAVFENCPLEYKYRHYLKLPLPGAPALSFGKTIHRTLQLYTTHYAGIKNSPQHDLFGEKVLAPLPDFQKVITWYEESWIDEWYENAKQKEEYKKLGLEMIGLVYNETDKTNPYIKYIEQEFKLKFGDYDLVGRIDRADVLEDGSLNIIDYKTGSTPKTKNKRDVDQLRLYQLAAEKYLGQTVSCLTYWYLKDNQKVDDRIATPEELTDFEAKICENIELIRETIKYDNFAELHKKAKQHNCNYSDLI